MKAIRVHDFGGPDVMKLETVADLKPAAGQVLVKVKAVGVNPVDTYIRSGKYARTPALPYTPGMDAAGTVEAVGERVASVAVGDRVYLAGTISGSYAEKALCSEFHVHALPKAVTFEQGAALGVPYATAYRALFIRAAARPNETVLIHGASGGVGIAAVQFARVAGMKVIATAGTDKGKSLVLKEGAHHVLDHTEPEYMNQILHLTDGKGLDVVVEMLANVNLGRDLKELARGGRVVVIGSRGPVEVDPRDTMMRDAAIFGMAIQNASEEELGRIHAAIFSGLENGTLRPVVGQTLPLKDASKAHTAVMTPGAYGKIVLIP